MDSILATSGTIIALRAAVLATLINKVMEGRPHVDAMLSGDIQLVLTRPKALVRSETFSLRQLPDQ